MTLLDKFRTPVQHLLHIVLPLFCLLLGSIVIANSDQITSTRNNTDCKYQDGIDEKYRCLYIAEQGALLGEDRQDSGSVDKDGKKMQFTNNGNQRLFIPSKTTAELNSFLAVKGTFNIEACEMSKRTSETSTFGYGVKGCTESVNCPSSCIGSWSTGGTGSCDGTYNSYFAGDTCSGTYEIIEKKDPWGNLFDWANGTKYFITSISHNGLISGVTAYSNGGNPGAYDIASSGGYNGCEAYYINGSNQWVYDKYTDETDQFDTRCLYGNDPYSTGNSQGNFSAPYVIISTNNSCSSVPLDQCATNQYYSGCSLNDSYTPTSCSGLPQQDCGTYQETSTCTWNGTSAQTFYCNTNTTESSCQQASNACSWVEDTICLETNICLNPTTTQAECNNNQGCSWSTANNRCHLDTQGCYQESNQSNCESSQSGNCFWYQNEYCMEQTQDCYENDTESVCNNTQGCYWDLFCKNDL